MNTADAIEREFSDAIVSAGLTPPPEITADGKLHRFSSSGKRGDDSGWFVLHVDGVVAGAFGDWRSGLSQTWRAKSSRSLSPTERTAQREWIATARRAREAEEARTQATAAERAATIWASAGPARADHPYLVRKRVKPHGLRVHRGALVVPMRDAAGALHSLQFIGAEGDKRFLSGGRVAACYYGLGRAPRSGEQLIVGEGFATAASISESTGGAVVVAFNAGNLEPVARALRGKYPEARIVIAADNDESGTGQRAAQAAARAVGAIVATPPTAGDDFNDVHRELGAASVCRILETACA